MDFVYATDERYLPYAAAAIRSCLDHHEAPVRIHVVHDGTLDGAALRSLATMVEAHGSTLSTPTVEPSVVDRLPGTARFGRAVWFRLLLPDLLPDVARAVYLDVDTLVCGPLDELFALDLEGSMVGAVTNVYAPGQRTRIEALGFTDNRAYFNSGVLLLDLAAMRRTAVTVVLQDLVDRRGAELEMPDQDALNLAFRDAWHPLALRFNSQTKFWEEPDVAAELLGRAAVVEALDHPAVVHFEGPAVCKPWHAMNTHPQRDAWRRTLSRTPFADTPVQRAGLVSSALRALPPALRWRVYFRLRPSDG